MNKDEIISFIKQNKGVEIATLQKQFDLTYKDAKSIIDELLSKGSLVYAEGVKYNYVDQKPTRSQHADDSDDDDEDDEDEDDEAKVMAERRDYLEARRQELIRRMQAEIKEDDEDEDDEDGDANDDEADSDIEPELMEVLHHLKIGINAQSHKEHIFIIPIDLNLYHPENCFEVIKYKEKIFITDRGATLIALHERVKLDTEGVDEEIGRITDRYGLTIAGDELRIEITEPTASVACLMQLFAAMEAIYNMDTDVISTCIEREKSDMRCRDIIAQLIEENKDINRTQAMMRVRDKWNEAQSADNFDAVYDYANTMRVLAALADADFELFRKHLLGVESEDCEQAPQEVGDKNGTTKDNVNYEGAEESSYTEEIAQTSKIIVDTLAEFRIDARVCKVTAGASITRYDITIPKRFTASSVIKRDWEIAMRLGLRDSVRIFADDEDGTIALEIPNKTREMVALTSVMNTEDFLSTKDVSLKFAIGKDIESQPVCGDLTKMRHLLIGGSTGSGKSEFLHSMIVSLISKYSPKDLRLILADSKQSEFMIYSGLPHLLTGEIITEAQPMVNALNWAIKEMERRYSLFKEKCCEGNPVRNIDEYNRKPGKGGKKLPGLVIIVDELADFMSVARRDIQERIQRLAQKSRAAGIHLVLATQRPSVDVVTGVIKANIPSRVAFRTICELDSRTLLDEMGAEKLIGRGDMLIRTEGDCHCKRVQGAFIAEDELAGIVKAVKERYKTHFDRTAREYINHVEEEPEVEVGPQDPICIKALAIVIKLGRASISLLQRKCQIGYELAMKILEWMESWGYISEFDDNSKARTVLITKEEFEAMYGPLD